MDLSDLKPQQYQEIYIKEEEPLQNLREEIYRRFIYGAVICALLMLIAGFTVQVPRLMRYEFEIKGKESELIYRFPQDVFVLQRFVAAGDSVDRGARLLRISSPEIVAWLEEYRSLQNKKSSFEKYDSLAAINQLAQLLIELQLLDVRKNNLENQLQVLEANRRSEKEKLDYELKEAQKVYLAHQKLFESRAISEQEFRSYEARKVALEAAVSSSDNNYHLEKNRLANQLRQVLLEKELISHKTEKLRLDVQAQQYQLAQDQQKLMEKIRNTYGHFEMAAEGIVLLSPQAARVSYLFEGEKQLPEGEVMLKLLGTGSSGLYAQLMVNPDNIGLIQPQQEVVLQMTTFPHYQYGTLRGHIFYKSITPNQKSEYVLKAGISDFGKLAGKLQIGMRGEALIVVETRSFFMLLFHQLKETMYY